MEPLWTSRGEKQNHEEHEGHEAERQESGYCQLTDVAWSAGTAGDRRETEAVAVANVGPLPAKALDRVETVWREQADEWSTDSRQT